MNEPEGRLFPLDTILSVTTHRLVASGHVGALYDVLNYMTRDNLFTHQLPRANDECAPWLLRWYPKLADVRLWFLDQLLKQFDQDDKQEACRAWVWIERLRLGLDAELLVQRIPQDDHRRINPYDELVIERGSDEGIVLVMANNPDKGEPNDRT